MKITGFVLDNSQNTLAIALSVNKHITDTQLSFEYLRVNSPVQQSKSGQANVISHKKNVVLTSIESVAKHGYRFTFNDGHSAIYNEDYIQTLVLEYEARWQGYLDELKLSGHSREAMIDIKQL